MRDQWYIEEVVSDDELFWNLVKVCDDGKLRMVAQCPHKADAEYLLGAVKWAQSLGMGLMSLRIDGVEFDLDTGRATVPRKRPIRAVAKRRKQ